MKKILSFALSVSMLATACFCGLSASAEEAPIKATPITDWSLNTDSSWEYVSAETVTAPVGTINANGIKISAKNDPVIREDGNLMANWQNIAGFRMDTAVKGTSGIIFYVKTSSANTIMPYISFAMPNHGYDYRPDMALGVGGTYQYKAIGASEWSIGTAVAGTPSTSIWGAVKFDSAFEGFIKIPYSALKNDNEYAVVCPDLEENAQSLTGVRLIFKGIGGEYGNTVFGPVMLINSDSSSPEIEVPEEFRPAPIKATPITNWAVSGNTWEYVKAETLYPVETIKAQGIKMSAKNNPILVDDESLNYWNNYTAFNMAEPQSLDGTSGIIFYLKTDHANRVLPIINIAYSSIGIDWITWSVQMALTEGANFFYKTLDEDNWKTGTAVKADSKQYNAAISFDAAFEGYIKIPYTSLSNDTISTIYTNQYKADNFMLKVKGIGGEYGDTVFGPVMLITADSPSPEIEVPEKFRPAPIEATVLSNCRYYNHNSAELTETYSQPVAGLAMRGITPAIAGEEMGLQADYPAASNLYSKLSYAESGIDKPLDASDATALLLYVEAQGDNVIVPTVSVSSASHSFDPDYALRVGAAYSYMRPGDTAWTTANAGASGYNETSSCFGTIALDDGFKGWIKINYSSFVSEVLSGQPFTGKDIVRITVLFAKIGLLDDGEHTLTVGPVAKVTADSVQTKINFTETVYETGDINFDRAVDGSDLVVLRKQLLDIIKADKVQSNINGDNGVDILDLVRLKKIIVEKTVG